MSDSLDKNHSGGKRKHPVSGPRDSDSAVVDAYTLLGFGAALTLIDNEEETARLTAGVIVSALRLPLGAILLQSALEGEVRVLGQSRNAPLGEALTEEIKQASTLSDESSCEIDVLKENLAEATAAGLCRFLLVRLRTIEHDFGVVIAGKSSQEPYSPAQTASLEFLAAQTSIALHRIQLNKSLAAKEAALQESEERFRRLSEASFEGIAITESGKLLDASEQFVEMFGYKLDEVIEMSTTEFVAPEYRDLVSKNILTGSELYELVGLRKDGSTFHAEARGKTIPYDGRKVRVTAIRDISERKLAEEELRKARDELELRVKELETFAYTVSHDLRSPLLTIHGFSQILSEDFSTKLNDKGKHYIELIQTNCTRMAQIIEDLLELSKISRDQLSYARVNLSELAASIAADLREREPKRQVEFAVIPDLIVQGDSRLLRLALENLLGNAWKFTSKHATATIELGNLDSQGQTVYYVRDDGAGFDSNNTVKLFGPFQRLHSDSEFEGTGVGLATVQRIIQRHGGKVWAEGEVEKGATFYFTLQD